MKIGLTASIITKYAVIGLFMVADNPAKVFEIAEQGSD
jgi:hypothetical protein